MPAACSWRAIASDFLERHAQQVPAVDRAHVEAMHVILGAEREHLGQRGADFIADHGEGEAGERHS